MQDPSQTDATAAPQGGNDPAQLFRGTMQEGFVGEAAVAPASVTAAVDPGWVLEESLAGVARECAIFTHAPLFTYAGLDFATMDPVREYVEAHPDGAACDVAYHDFADPLFVGMSRGRPEFEAWDRRLFFIPLPYWGGLVRWLAEVAPVDRHGRVYHRARPQLLRIVDRAAVERRTRLLAPVPTVHITVFTVTGTVHNVRWRADVATPAGRAKVDRLPLDPRIRREADRVLGHHPNPLRVAAGPDRTTTRR